MIVYIHRNPQTKQIFYVGIGVNKERAYKFKGKQRNQYWHNYVKKYGQPVVEIVAEFETREQAVELELQLIAKYGRLCDNSGCLVNITIGGDGGALGVKQSDETIEKRISQLRCKTHSKESKSNMTNAQNRPEVKAKHSIYKNDPAWREMQRQLKLGGKLTNEHKSKIGLASKGRVVSEETRKKISIANKGKVRTEEQRKKIGEVQKGRIRSKEAIEKAAISHYKLSLIHI